MRFSVTIYETTIKQATVTIEASNAEDAEISAEEAYDRGEIDWQNSEILEPDLIVEEATA